jgi:hypothetical protein
MYLQPKGKMMNRFVEWAKGLTWMAWAILLLGILLMLSIGVSWYRENHRPVLTKTVYQTVKEIKESLKIKRVEIPVDRIVVLEKKSLDKIVGLSDDLKTDEAKQVTATGVIPPYEGDTNVLAVIDTNTGKSTIEAKQVPLSFMDFENKKAVGARCGVSTKSVSSVAVDVYARWDFLRVERCHLGLYGEAGSEGNAKAQMQVEYRW